MHGHEEASKAAGHALTTLGVVQINHLQTTVRGRKRSIHQRGRVSRERPPGGIHREMERGPWNPW